MLKNKKKKSAGKKTNISSIVGQWKEFSCCCFIIHWKISWKQLERIRKKNWYSINYLTLYNTPLISFYANAAALPPFNIKSTVSTHYTGDCLSVLFLFVIFVVSSSFEFININFNINFTLVIKRRQLEKRYYVDILPRYSLMCLGLEEIFVWETEQNYSKLIEVKWWKKKVITLWRPCEFNFG